MALGATSCSDKIYDAFLSEDKTKTLFHGHSYTANPVACSASLASLDLLEHDSTWKSINRIHEQHLKFQKSISGKENVKDCRVKGTILAVEFKAPPLPKGGITTRSNPTEGKWPESSSKGGIGESSGYFSSIRDRLYNFFIERKIILRPLGNVVYVMPPYCISNEDLDIIYASIAEALEKIAP
jgi:adenosylmethionine-8-amino-7-oxononanoate aminotransferase